MAISDLGAQVKLWALEEAAKVCLGEDYGVDVSWSPQPVQAQQGIRMLPAWLLLITARSPLLGQGALYHLAPLGTPLPEEAQVRAEVGNGIKLLRELAASQLSGGNGGARLSLAREG